MGEVVPRLEQLRHRFDAARKRLAAIPETGLSADGQPHIREVAEALQSFASWFGESTLDDMAICGSAYKVHEALNGLDAIADWVGLHRSQQFAADIREHVGELVEQSEALDAKVSAAFTVKQTASEVVWSQSRRVPKSKRDAIEDAIQAVASMAGHLAVRLQRVAVMTVPRPAKADGKQKKHRDRKGIGGRREKYSMKFIREVAAARERDIKQNAKAKTPLPPLPRWLRDYCDGHDINIRERFPPAFDGEPWQTRANRFWKAAKTRLSRAGN